MPTQTNTSRPIPVGKRKEFMLAGKSIFTVENPETGKRYTFKINYKSSDDSSRFTSGIFFVSYLYGPDNTKDYRYIGIITEAGLQFKITKKSRPGTHLEAFKYIWQHTESERFVFYHEGRCGKCGRRLTVPESIDAGFGPVCGGFTAKKKEAKQKAKQQTEQASLFHALETEDRCECGASVVKCNCCQKFVCITQTRQVDEDPTVVWCKECIRKDKVYASTN